MFHCGNSPQSYLLEKNIPIDILLGCETSASQSVLMISSAVSFRSLLAAYFNPQYRIF